MVPGIDMISNAKEIAKQAIEKDISQLKKNTNVEGEPKTLITQYHEETGHQIAIRRDTIKLVKEKTSTQVILKLSENLQLIKLSKR